MLLIRSQFFNLLMYLVIFVIGTAYIPLAWRSKKGAYKGIYKAIDIIKFLTEKILGITWEYQGKIPPNEPALICSKHMSFLDILMIARILPQARFIMKAELRYVPILSFYARAIGAPPVKRGKKGAAIKELLSNLENNIEGQITIFPQGRRVKPGEKLPYKTGAFAIYEAFNLPVYLVATNVGVLWARKSSYRYPGTAVMKFLETRIEPGMNRDEFMNIISENIEIESDKLMEQYPAKK